MVIEKWDMSCITHDSSCVDTWFKADKVELGVTKDIVTLRGIEVDSERMQGTQTYWFSRNVAANLLGAQRVLDESDLTSLGCCDEMAYRFQICKMGNGWIEAKGEEGQTYRFEFKADLLIRIAVVLLGGRDR